MYIPLLDRLNIWGISISKALAKTLSISVLYRTHTLFSSANRIISQQHGLSCSTRNVISSIYRSHVSIVTLQGLESSSLSFSICVPFLGIVINGTMYFAVGCLPKLYHHDRSGTNLLSAQIAEW